MKKIKRVVSLLAAVLLLLTTSACNDVGDAGGNPDHDLTGDLLAEGLITDPNYGKSASMYESIRGTTVNLAFYSDLSVDTVEAEIVEEFEKEYGVTVEDTYYDWFSWGDRFFQLVASGQHTDNAWIADTTFLNSLSRNVLQPVDEWIDWTDTVWTKGYADEFMYKGEHYAMTCADDANYYIYYNKDLFADLGVEDPQEMWEDGRWNFDTFRAAAKACVADTDGDGAQDRWGFGTWFYEVFVLANGGRVLEMNEDGTLSCTLGDEASVAGYQLVQDLTCVDKSWGDDGDLWSSFANGKVGMLCERTWHALGNYDMHSQCDFEIGVVPVPNGPNVTGDKWLVPTTITTMGMVTGAENPLAVCAYYHFRTLWYNRNYARQDLVNGTAKTYGTSEMFKWHQDFKARSDVQFIATQFHGTGVDRGPFYSDILSGIPIATCIDTHKGTFESAINTLQQALLNRE